MIDQLIHNISEGTIHTFFRKLNSKNIGRRGMVICPPALIGDKELSTGWWSYINEFKLYDWEVESSGRLEDIAETIRGRDIEVIIWINGVNPIIKRFFRLDCYLIFLKRVCSCYKWGKFPSISSKL